MPNNTVNGFFYSDRDRLTRRSAEIILKSIQPIIDFRSVIDVGCGVGTWPAVAKRSCGCGKVRGVDGEWVDQNLLEITKDEFNVSELNLKRGPSAQTLGTWDLAISLEVAEHLRPEDADWFVKLLTSLSKVVLFSAAIPRQGGFGHFNEQWPQYWAEKFSGQGFRCVDFIRRTLWEESQILPHYRQNCFLFISEQESALLESFERVLANADFPMSAVHPFFWMQRTESPTIHFQYACGLAIKSLGDAVKRRLGFYHSK